MTADSNLLYNGGIYSYDRKPSTRVWEKVYSPEIGSSVLDESIVMLGIKCNVFGATIAGANFNSGI